MCPLLVVSASRAEEQTTALGRLASGLSVDALQRLVRERTFFFCLFFSFFFCWLTGADAATAAASRDALLVRAA